MPIIPPDTKPLAVLSAIGPGKSRRGWWPGDRRDDDLILLGKLSAKCSIELLLRKITILAVAVGGSGRFNSRGISQENASMRPEVILDETEALEKALSTVSEGGLVVIFPESVTQAIDLIEKHRPLNR
jgi:cyanophycin synthetase